MNQIILSLLDQPAELEKLYRKNKTGFTRSFTELYPSLKGNPLADAWYERLHFESDGIQWGSKGDWQFIVIAALLAGTLAKFPALFDIKDESFYPRNLGFVVFPFLYAYFIRKNKLPFSAVLVPLITTLLAVGYINFLPEAETSDTLILACIHLPLFLWGMLGFVYSGANLKDLGKRLSYLNYNGETIIVGASFSLQAAY